MKNVLAGVVALLAVVAVLWWLRDDPEQPPPEAGEAGAAPSSPVGPELAEDAAPPEEPSSQAAPPARLEVQVLWKHSAAGAQQGDVSLAPATGQDDPRRSVVHDGQALIEYPAGWTSGRLAVDHPGAEPISERLTLPHSGPRIVHLQATHAVAGRITTKRVAFRCPTSRFRATSSGISWRRPPDPGRSRG